MNPFKELNKQFINGEWKDGRLSKEANISDPFDDSVLTTVKLASPEDIDEAYKSAKRAQKEWAATSAEKKTAIIDKAIQVIKEHHDTFVDTIVRETGSTILKANIELGLAMGIMSEAKTFPHRMEPEKHISHVPGKENYLYREPVGVVGIISPFNFPFHLSMRSIAPAIATGNAVVHKPDLQTAISGGGLIAKIFELAGLPKGVFNVIMTDIPEIGDAFIEHPIPSVISFTGSTAVGKHVGAVAGQNLKKVALELGGNSPFIVLKDADIKQAVNAAIFGKFIHQGQICMIINRFLVDRSIYDEFTDEFVSRVSALKYGDPKDTDTVIGPLINSKQLEKVQKLIDSAIAEGATVALEGRRVGNVFSPYVFTNVKNSMTLAQNEVFGPVASIIPFDTEEEAIRLANDTEYGLSAAIFTQDLERGHKLAKLIDSGMAHVNDQTVNDEPHIPFGGEKASGIGRYGGDWAIDEFTSMRWVSVQKQDREYPF